jgi:hypothetical protein
MRRSGSRFGVGRSWHVPAGRDRHTRHDGDTYFVTANEGDARDWDAFAEEERISDLVLEYGVSACRRV